MRFSDRNLVCLLDTALLRAIVLRQVAVGNSREGRKVYLGIGSNSRSGHRRDRAPSGRIGAIGKSQSTQRSMARPWLACAKRSRRKNHTADFRSMPERTFTHPKTGAPAKMNTAAIGKKQAA